MTLPLSSPAIAELWGVNVGVAAKISPGFVMLRQRKGERQKSSETRAL